MGSIKNRIIDWWQSQDIRKFPCHLLALTGLILCAVSLSVMYGWMIENRALIQIRPDYAPMQFNTALGFLLLGLSSLFLSLKRAWLSSLFGLGVVLIAGITLFQYIFNVNTGLDELFTTDFTVMTQTTHPGRPSPSTALCFLLLGAAFSLGSRTRIVMTGLVIASLVMVLLTALGYMFPSDDVLGWGTLTRMAIHTVGSFFIVSVSSLVFLLSSCIQTTWKHDKWRLLAFCVATVIITISVFSSYTLQEKASVEKLNYMQWIAKDIEHETEEIFYSDYKADTDWFKQTFQWSEVIHGYVTETIEEQKLILEIRDQNGLLLYNSAYKEIKDPSAGYITQFFVGDEYLHIGIYPDIAYQRPVGYFLSWMVGIMGVLMAFLIYFLILYIVNKNENIEREVLKQTRKLHETHMHMRMVMDAIPDMLYVKDVDSNIVEANKEFLKRSGLHGVASGDGIKGLDSYQLRELHSFINNSDDTKAFKQGYAHLNERMVFPDGSIVFLETFKRSFEANGHQFLLNISRDVSEKKENEERIDLLTRMVVEASYTASFNDFLEVVLEMTCNYIGWPIGHAYIWDDETHKLEPTRCWHISNSAGDVWDFKEVTERTSFSPGQGLPGRVYKNQQPAWIVDIAKDTNFPRNRLLKEINLHSAFGLPVISKNGEVRVVLEFFTRDVVKQDFRLFSLWEAISSHLGQVLEHKEAEEERLRYTYALEEAKEMANQANQMKTDFLANMSHEIRTPLNGIIGAAELLKHTKISDVQNSYLNVLVSSGDRLLSIINNVLDLSKIEADQMELNPEPLVLGDFLRDIVQSVTPKANENRIELTVNTGKKIPYSIMVDTVRLSQIMTNLMGNAVKFVKDGTVTLSVENITENKEPTPEGLITLRFSVKDTGIGIPPEKLDIIFEKFSQVDASTTKSYGGTGLGLAITKKLVEMMKGKISVESQVGIGTDFMVDLTLPVVEWEDSGAVRRMEEIFGKIKILVVDDMNMSLKFTSLALGKMGIEHDTVDNAKEALSILKTAHKEGKPFDIVLTDFDMPEMNGIELAQKIRKNKTLKSIKVVVMSALGKMEVSDNNLEKLVSDGTIDETLLKPIEVNHLRRKIITILDETNMGKKVIVYNHEVEENAKCLAIKGSNILLVENEIVNQMVATEMLELLECNVYCAQNGAEAVKMVKQNQGHFDAILMDCMMPVMDGFEATRVIRDLEATQKISGRRNLIIAMTANTMADERSKCIECGMDDYLAKPIKEDDLCTKLYYCMNKNTEKG